jgi:hypothetical protein
MGGVFTPPIFIKKRNMKFSKKILFENMNLKTNGLKNYSEKPQSVIVTESQLERVIQKILKKK